MERLESIFLEQAEVQVEQEKRLGNNELIVFPIDDPNRFSQWALSMIEEVGEALKTDRRYRNYRNKYYNQDSKVEEIADVAICLVNLCLYSEVGVKELLEAIERKQRINSERDI